MSDKSFSMPHITGVTWDDLDDDCDWEGLMTNNMSREDVDNVYGPDKTEREQQFMDTEEALLIQLDKRRNVNTPDFLELKLQKNNFVFVYGTLKQDGFYHDILKDSQYLGVGITVEPNYLMRETSSFPVVTIPKTSDKGDYQKRGKVRGEVYQVSPLTMLRLDQLEANGRMYKRRKAWVKLMDQMSSGILPSIEVWMYIGNDEFFDIKNLHKVGATHNGQHLVYDWDVTQDMYAA